MKSTIFQTLILCFVAGISFAQQANDVIYKKNGTSEKCEIAKVDDAKIKYKIPENIDGPLYNVLRKDVSLVIKSNGEYLLPAAASATFTMAADLAYDKIITADNRVLAVTGLEMVNDAVSYTDAFSAAKTQLKKSDIQMVFFKDGKHMLIAEPEAAAQTLTLLHGKLSTYSNKVVATTAAVPVVEEKPVVETKAVPTATTVPSAASDAGNAVAVVPVATTTITAGSPSAATPTATQPATEAKPVTTSGNSKNAAEKIIDYEAFSKKALKKTEDLSLYLQLISDKSTDYQDVNDAIDLATALFVSENAQVEVSSVNGQKKSSFKIRDYLNRLKLLKYDKVEITWADISYVSNFRLGTDGNYYATVSVQQTFKGFNDNKLAYTDVTEKYMEIVLKGYKKEVDGKAGNYWDVLLSDIGVVNTKAN